MHSTAAGVLKNFKMNNHTTTLASISEFCHVSVMFRFQFTTYLFCSPTGQDHLPFYAQEMKAKPLVRGTVHY